MQYLCSFNTNYNICKNVEIIKKHIFFKENIFVKENKESIRILRNVLF